MGFLSVMFSFQGRIGRPYYWLWAVLYVVYLILLRTGLTAAGVSQSASHVAPSVDAGKLGGWVVVVLFSLLLMAWTSLAVHIKRWHDRDKSGWWVLIGLIPIVGGIWTLIECGFLPGTAGVNRYGSPLGGVPDVAANFD